MNTLTDEMVVSAGAALGWKATDPAKIRNLLNLNMKSPKVGAAIQAEYEKVAAQAEKEGHRLTEDDQDGVSFGMAEDAAAKYIVDTFGLVPRMAKRAIDRGINRDEYHGKGYIVKVIDLDFGGNEFDIQVFAA